MDKPIVPQQSGYPQPAPGSQGGYPPAGSQGGYPPPGSQGGYPPPGSQGGYPPPVPGQGMYPPGQPGYPPAGGAPIQTQPGMAPAPGAIGTQWASAPQMPANCPPGLEYLSMVDQMLVKQKVEVFEAFSGCETNNRYEVLNSMGQKVYTAKEDTCCCFRCCCGTLRPFDIRLQDNGGREVMHMSRPCRCNSCWFFCCLQKMTVEAPPGMPIGYVKQSCHLCGMPRYRIMNGEEEDVLHVHGPCCMWNICGDLEFHILAGDTKVGKITKEWSGLAKEAFTDADNFGVNFPLDLEVKTKATTLGAVFLIDFMYFESSGKGGDKKVQKASKGMMHATAL